MKHLSIGWKLTVSFGAVLLLLAVVALWSNRGIAGIVANARMVIDADRLRGEIAQREIDHLNWAKQVNALFTDSSVTKLEVQTDPHLCGFGKWYYGEERREAERLIPALAPILSTIEKPHADLHASAIAIGKTFVQADPELPGLLAARAVDHLKWAGVIRDALLHRAERLEVQTDHTRCAFGAWLASDKAKAFYEQGDADFRRAWDELLDLHEKLHGSAKDIVAAIAVKDHAGALSIFNEITAPLLDKTLAHLDELRAEADHELAGTRAAAKIYAEKTQPALNAVQDLLRRLRETVDANIITDEQMLATATRTNSAVGVISLLSIGLGVLCAFLMARAVTGPSRPRCG